MTRKKPVVLCVLDGWGYSVNTEGNVINPTNTPNWYKMLEEYPHNLLEASGEAVGLPAGQMGNSEVGHTNIGAGRVVMQLLGLIEKNIKENTLKDNKFLHDFIEKTKSKGGDCHLFGLISDGGVHAHIDHIIALAKTISEEGIYVRIHAVTDGRDTPPQSAITYISQLLEVTKEHKNIEIATISGRYYAMDRNKTWDRVKLAYDAIVEGKSKTRFTNPMAAIEASYENDITDEFIVPTCAEGYTSMKDGDSFLIANYRADRVREIADAIANPEFNYFPRDKVINFSSLLGMAEYSEDLNKLYGVLYPATPLKNIFGEVIADAGLCQLRIAETEKYAHVTFFLNGGNEKVFHCEERILIPSPAVATYDLKPEMSAYEITDNLERVISEDKFDVIIVNFANGDMVGHSGIEEATVKAAITIDNCIERLKTAVLAKQGVLFITADHGNCEKMLDETGKPFTAHTSNPVEGILIGVDEVKNLNRGKLADIAPTLLKILGLEVPKEMEGKPLF